MGDINPRGAYRPHVEGNDNPHKRVGCLTFVIGLILLVILLVLVG